LYQISFVLLFIDEALLFHGEIIETMNLGVNGILTGILKSYVVNSTMAFWQGLRKAMSEGLIMASSS